MKVKIFALVLFFIFPLMIFSQNVNGRFSSSVYTFERLNSATESETYYRTFQTLILRVNKNNFALRTRMNLEANLSNSLDGDPRLRFYNLYVEGRNLLGIATVKLGRQSLFSSVAGGLYDGLNIKLKYHDYSLSAFCGGNVPAYQKLELTEDFGDNNVIGAEFSTTALKNFIMGLSYINKNYKPEPYTTTRLDANLDPITLLIQRNSNQFHYLSGKINYELDKIIDVYSKLDYDINFAEISKFEISTRYSQIDKLGINLYYNFREPQINYNSIFSVFNYGNTQEIEGGVDYEINKNYTVIGKFGNVTYEDEESQRLTLGVNSTYGTFSYRKTFGYAGEMDAFSVYTAKSYYDGKITPSIGLAYTNYKLSEESETNSITSLLAGCNFRPWKTVSFDLQTQYFNNKIYKNDFRVLFKFNHWFNTNLGVL